jgi:hypothetical protein
LEASVTAAHVGIWKHTRLHPKALFVEKVNQRDI